MKIAVTGQQPDKIYGFDIFNERWTHVKEVFKSILLHYGCTEARTCMNLGTDIVFALAVLELKDEGHDILLHCFLPSVWQDSFWIEESRELYHDILMKADIITAVTRMSQFHHLIAPCDNHYLVDHADLLLALWDGSCGSTEKCVRYAAKRSVETIIMVP